MTAIKAGFRHVVSYVNEHSLPAIN